MNVISGSVFAKRGFRLFVSTRVTRTGRIPASLVKYFQEHQHSERGAQILVPGEIKDFGRKISNKDRKADKHSHAVD